MAYFEPHLRAMWRSHHGCEPPLMRAGAPEEAGTPADAAVGGPQGAAAEQVPSPQQDGGAAGDTASSSVIYGMLRSGFSWEELCANTFQMFFAGKTA
jgi:hypothetical protein